jgi:predicted small secreted protein
MRALVCMALVSAAMLCGGCNTYRVAGAVTFGRTQDISAADIEAAVAAYRKMVLGWGGVPYVGQIEVRSHDCVRIYMDDASGGWTEMLRHHDKWVQGASVIVTS